MKFHITLRLNSALRTMLCSNTKLFAENLNRKLFMAITLAIFFCSFNRANAQTFNYFVSNDHLVSPTVFEFDVSIQNTYPIDILLSTVQHCFTFNPAFINGATIAASYVAGSTQMVNYAPGVITFSAAANGFQVGANTGVSCSNGTIIPKPNPFPVAPKRVATFRLTATSGNFSCVASNPNMVMTGDVPAPSGLGLRMAVTEWLDNSCAFIFDDNITGPASQYTRFATLTQYGLVNNNTPPITISGSTSFCAGSSTTLDAGSYAGFNWSTGATTQTISVNTAGNFIVTVTALNGCTGTGSIDVIVNPYADVNQPANEVVCNNSSTSPVNLTSSLPGTIFNWTNNNTSIGLAASGTGNIDSFTATNTGTTPVTATITVTSGGSFAYITNQSSNNVSVINTANNTVVATVPVGTNPRGVSVSPDGSRVYVVNVVSYNVSVINTATNAVVATVPVGTKPEGVSVSPDGSWVYVANELTNNVSVINAATNTVVDTVPVGSGPAGVSVSPNGSRVYVANIASDNVSVINTATNTVVATVPVGSNPIGVSVSPDGSRVYVVNSGTDNVSVINTATNAVVATVPVGDYPQGVSVSPSGSRVYVANQTSNNVSVINTANNAVVATVAVGAAFGISVSPDGSRVYVANRGTNNVSVINTANNAVVATVAVGAGPQAFGNFITGGTNCTGTPKTFTYTVNPTPLPSITGDTIFCAGDTVELNAGSFAAYSWSTGATTQTISVNSAGTFTVTVTDASGCTGTDSVDVNLYPGIAPTCSSSNPTCLGNSNGMASVIVSPAGLYQYAWSNGATTSSLSVLPAGTYTVTITDANGCTATCISTVTDPPALIANCSGTNVTCYGGNDGRVSVTTVPPDIITVYIRGNLSGDDSNMHWDLTDASNNLVAYGYSNFGDYSYYGFAQIPDTNGPYSLYIRVSAGSNFDLNHSAGGTWAIECNGNFISDGEVLDCLGCPGDHYANIPNLGCGKSYLWSNGATTASISGLTAANYCVTVTNENGCTDTCCYNVTEPPPITCSIVGDTIFCAGDSTQLCVSTASSYLWSNGTTSQCTYVSTAGNFTVTVTNASGCTGSATVTTTVNPNPTPTISGNTSLCDGSSTTLDAGAFSSYNWSTGATTQTISVITAGTFTVTVTNANGCTGSASATTIVNANPTPSISGSLSFCAGSSTTLDAGAFSIYNWSTGATTQTISVNSAATFTVTVTNANGCTGSASVTTTINSNLTPTITGNLSFCAGSSTTLSAGVFTSYNWSTGATTQTISVNTAGTFTVTVTNGNGCTGSTSVTTTVNQLPVPSISGAASFCAGSSTTLNAGAFAGYNWSTGATTQTISVNTAGTFMVTVTNGNGCTGSTSVATTVNQLPVPSISGAKSFCAGSSTTLSAGVFTSYYWSTGATTQTISVNTAGTFTVTVTNANGCTGSTSATTTVNPNPTPTISGNTSFCAGSSTTLSAGVFTSYNWSTGATTQTISVNTAATFTVTVTNANGCTGSASVTTTINSNLAPTITGNLSFCAGSSTTLSAGVFTSYNWSTGATTQTISVNTAGIFTVTVTNGNGCTGSTSVTTTVNQLPVPSISGATSFCAGSSTTLNAGAFASYNWSTGATTQTISVNTAGTFTVTVTDANGCTGATSTVVSQSTLAGDCSGTNPTCGNADGTAAVTVIGGVPPYSYLWSNNATDSTITGLSAGTYTVTVTDAFGCTDTCSVALINGGSGITPTISCNAAFCVGKSTVLDAGAGYAHYLWSTGKTTQTITATTASTFTVTVTNTSGCTGSTSVTTIVYPLPVVSFSGLPSSCNVSAGPSTLTGSPSGGTFSGKGISGNKFYPNVAGIGGPYTITYTYTNYNGCTKSITHQISVTGTCYTPSSPGAISGPASGVCKQTAVQYAVPYVSGINFQWSFNTSYATITSGQGTNNITVKFLSSFTSGILSVKASNNCGTSLAKTLSIVAAPAKPGSITGVSSVCKNKQNVAYSIVAVNGATNYTWTGPTGSKIKDGLYISSGNSYTTSSTSIKVNFGTYAGNVQVKANNQCGSSSASTKYVSISCREEGEMIATNFDVHCYPNPASAEINVLFYSEEAVANTIRITDVLGKTLLQQINHSAVGENKYLLDVSILSSGIYMIEVLNGEQKRIQKIMIE